MREGHKILQREVVNYADLEYPGSNQEVHGQTIKDNEPNGEGKKVEGWQHSEKRVSNTLKIGRYKSYLLPELDDKRKPFFKCSFNGNYTCSFSTKN